MKKFWMVLNAAVGARSSTGVPQVALYSYWPTKQEAIDDMKRRAAASSKQSQQQDWYVAEAINMAQIPMPDITVTDLKD